MPAFETANVEVRMGGDVKNSVVKYRVTAAEIMILRAIHGDDSIVDVMPLDASDDVKRSNANERARLRGLYTARDGESLDLVIDRVWPGAGAYLPSTIAELELPDHAFKPVSGQRHAPRSSAPEGRRGAPKQNLIQDQDEDFDLEDEDAIDEPDELPSDDFLADEDEDLNVDDGTDVYGTEEQTELKTAPGDQPWLNTETTEEAPPAEVAATEDAPAEEAKPAPKAKKNKAVPL